MTDSQSLIPNSLGLTDDLLYYLKKSSGRGRSYRCSVQPTNAQTFAPGSTTILYIPCGRKSTFLDTQQSYIKFTLQNNDTNNTINVDGCAASLINRIDTVHASNSLESIIYSFKSILNIARSLFHIVSFEEHHSVPTSPFPSPLGRHSKSPQ
jgi:hypothetical protein